MPKLSASTVLALLQECYGLLHSHGIATPQEQVERVDTLRYMWQRLQQQVMEVQDVLLKIQPMFRDTLVESVAAFQEGLGTFVGDYSTVSAATLQLLAAACEQSCTLCT